MIGDPKADNATIGVLGIIGKAKFRDLHDASLGDGCQYDDEEE